MTHKQWAGLFTVLVMPVAFLCVASAQITTGSIIGFITDTSGGPISGAGVTVTNVDTGFSHKLTTQDDGSYRALLMPTGRYTVSATKEGFETSVQEGIPLAVNQDARVDVTMRVGSVNEKVVVKADAIA